MLLSNKHKATSDHWGFGNKGRKQESCKVSNGKLIRYIYISSNYSQSQGWIDKPSLHILMAVQTRNGVL